MKRRNFFTNKNFFSERSLYAIFKEYTVKKILKILVCVGMGIYDHEGNKIKFCCCTSDNSNLSILKLLIEYGAKVDEKCIQNAKFFNDTKILEFLGENVDKICEQTQRKKCVIL